MRTLLPLAAIAAAAFGLAACDLPRTNSAYINSGASATPAMPASDLAAPVAGAAQEPAAAPAQRELTTAPAISDTASPSTAPAAGAAASPGTAPPSR